MPQGLPWLRMDGHGRLEVLDEANNSVLVQLGDKPCNLISIFGAARQGKSFLMNLLSGHENLFQVSNGRKPCTQGVDICSHVMPLDAFASLDGTETPADLETSDMVIGFVDSEGQGDQDVTYDARKNTFQKDNILNLLASVAYAAKGVSVKQQQGNSKGSSEKPFAHLHIVFRDWNFINSQEADIYRNLFDMESSGSEVDRLGVTARNNARKDLLEAFQSFWGKLKQMRSLLVRQLSAPTLFAGRPMTGEQMSFVVPAVVRVLNEGQVVMPQPILQTMLQAKINVLKEQLMQRFDEGCARVREFIGTTPVQPQKISSDLATAARQLLQMFRTQTAGRFPPDMVAAAEGALERHSQRESARIKELNAQLVRVVDQTQQQLDQLASRMMKQFLQECELLQHRIENAVRETSQPLPMPEVELGLRSAMDRAVSAYRRQCIEDGRSEELWSLVLSNLQERIQVAAIEFHSAVQQVVDDMEAQRRRNPPEVVVDGTRVKFRSFQKGMVQRFDRRWVEEQRRRLAERRRLGARPHEADFCAQQ